MTNMYLKKLLALVLSFALCLSMFSAVCAADDPLPPLNDTGVLEADTTVDDAEPDELYDSENLNIPLPECEYAVNGHGGGEQPPDAPTIDENSRLDIVRDYGANGNDKRSDSTDIQAALDDAAGTGATVYIPEGEWYLTAPLQIGSDCNLECAPDAHILRHPSTLEIFMMVPKTTGEGYSGFSNVTISGGIWDGNADPEHFGNMIYLFHGSNIHLKDMDFRNCCGDHFVELAGLTDSSITNCTFRDFIRYYLTNYDGVSTSTPDNPLPSITSEAIQLDATNENDSTATAPFDDTPCKNITISGCEFTNVMSGIGNHHSVVPAENVVIEGNTFTDIYSTCFNMYGFTDFSIRNNSAANIRRFVMARSGSTGTVSQNTCSYLSANPTAMIYLDDVAIHLTENVIQDSGTNAVYINHSTAPMTMKDNTVSTTSSSGAAFRIVDCTHLITVSSSGTAADHPLKSTKGNTISVSNAPVSLKNLYLSASGSSGIYITNQDAVGTCTVSGCDIRSSKKCAINAAGAGAVVKVSSTNINNCPGTKDTSGALITGFGISVSGGANLTATENTMTKQGLYGIYVDGATATLTGNKLYISGKEGIFITNSAKVTATSNQIGSTSNPDSVPSGAGLYAENSTVALKTNKLYSCKKGGIRLYKLKAAATVSSNKLTGIIGDGITVSSCTKKVTMSANTITSPTGNAINAASSYLSATENIIKTPGKNGISLTKCDSVQNTVNTNTITSPKNTGIRLENSWVSAASNIISNPVACGFFVTGASSKGTVTKNTVSGSGSHSIYLSGCSTNAITVSYNKISAAKGDSIRALSSRASITYNTITTPGANGIYLTKCSAASVPVSYNKVTAAVGDGIRVSESKATVNNNTVTSTTKNGIYILSASTATVKANTVTKSKGYDILFAKGCKGSILDNRVTKTSKISNPAKVTCKGNKRV